MCIAEQLLFHGVKDFVHRSASDFISFVGNVGALIHILVEALNDGVQFRVGELGIYGIGSFHLLLPSYCTNFMNPEKRCGQNEDNMKEKGEKETPKVIYFVVFVNRNGVIHLIPYPLITRKCQAGEKQT
jgi:hypothetical protein